MRAQFPITNYLPATPVDPIKFFAVGGVGGTADGGIYDIQDLSTMFQDQLSTASAVGQPVGVILSKAHDTTRGTNITNNGDFPTVTTGWTGASATLSIVSAQLRVTNSGAAAGRAHQNHATVPGTCYEITVDLKTNANGAAIAVGSNNSVNQMLLLTYAGGVTQNSITAYFNAVSTTSFVQLRTTSATAGHFTEWDNVTVKKVPGHHMIQPNASQCPILRQDAEGWYYLESDGTKVLQGGLGFTVQNGTYMGAALRRDDTPGLSAVVSLGKSSTAYFRIAASTGNGFQMQLRDAAGLSVITSPGSIFPNNARASFDGRVGASGFFDVAKNRRLPVSTTSATGFTSNTNSAMVFWGLSGITGTPLSVGGDIGYAWFMDQDPGADRAGCRAFTANKINAD